MKKILFAAFSLVAATLSAQRVLSLEDCLASALEGDRQLQAAEARRDAAAHTHAAARTNYLPKFALKAGYMRSGDEVSLLSSAQRGALSGIGSSLLADAGGVLQQLVSARPELAPLAPGLVSALQPAGQWLDAAGRRLADAFRTDTRNVAGGAVTLTQPLYMGGKIKAYDRITATLEGVAADKQRMAENDLRLDVETAYWRVVSIAAKRRLAESYVEALERFSSDMHRAVEHGMATRSEELSVNVRAGEAGIALLRADNGLRLARMALLDLIGLDIEDSVVLADEESDAALLAPTAQADDDSLSAAADAAGQAAARAGEGAARPELAALDKAVRIADAKIDVERSALLPHLALEAGYMVTNPSLKNGFENKFRGTWAVGATLSVPLWQWGEGRHKMRAAEAEARVARLEAADAADKIRLQIRSCRFRLSEARGRMAQAARLKARADENLRMARFGHSEGVITAADLLAAHTAWLDAHAEEVDAAAAFAVARAALRHAQGRLPDGATTEN